MPPTPEQLADLLHDYPELAAGLAAFFPDEGDAPQQPLTGAVGLLVMLKLRLHAVVQRLPQASTDEQGQPGQSSEGPA